MVSVALALAGEAKSSKILFVVAFPGKSHWLMFKPIINEVRIFIFSD